MARRPRVGITMRLEQETHRFYLGRHYCEAIEASGGIPIHLGLIPKKDYIAHALEGLDGVLLPGSNTDVDPHYYGEDPHPRLGTVIPEKDTTERLVLDEIDRRNLPTLAICYGMQALNVHRGGSLIQDIDSQVENCIKHEQGPPANRNSHAIKVDPNGFLSMLDTESDFERGFRVNSSHHQAIGKVGENLRAVAWANDGIIEALEDARPERSVFAVQWHPELTYQFDDVSKAIFERFIEICSKN